MNSETELVWSLPNKGDSWYDNIELKIKTIEFIGNFSLHPDNSPTKHFLKILVMCNIYLSQENIIKRYAKFKKLKWKESFGNSDQGGT